MNSEEEIRLKIRKIEALFRGSEFTGEKAAAEAALKRIHETLSNTLQAEPELDEYTFTFSNHWAKKLFIALCRRHELRPLSICTSKAYDCYGKSSTGFC